MKPEDCIFFQLAKAHQLGSRFLAQKVAALNITPVQALVPGFLADEDGITSSELGKRTELDSANMTGLLHRLHAAQDAVVENVPDDERWRGFQRAGYFEVFRRIEMVRPAESVTYNDDFCP